MKIVADMVIQELVLKCVIEDIILIIKSIQKLMKTCGIKCQVSTVKYHSYKGEMGKISPNLVNRNFHAQKPNQNWIIKSKLKGLSPVQYRIQSLLIS